MTNAIESDEEGGQAIAGAASTVEIACDRCPTGVLAEIHEGLGYHCTTCGYDDTICESCGAQMTFAADHRATTTGGLAIVGACACVACDVYLVCRRSKPAEAVDWTLAKSGRSVHAGGIKLRAENAPGVEALMARIVRVPELELEIDRLRDLLARRIDATAERIDAWFKEGSVSAELDHQDGTKTACPHADEMAVHWWTRGRDSKARLLRAIAAEAVLASNGGGK